MHHAARADLTPALAASALWKHDLGRHRRDTEQHVQVFLEIAETHTTVENHIAGKADGAFFAIPPGRDRGVSVIGLGDAFKVDALVGLIAHLHHDALAAGHAIGVAGGAEQQEDEAISRAGGDARIAA